ncbi:response regulator [Azohydromonas aeria]|uniref:response regulator n=1 Tax=Azohydromonas aeria TaxID=2590212 RepID=UPI0012F89A45|nr:response regulator [Azohydromonas aeria]
MPVVVAQGAGTAPAVQRVLRVLVVDDMQVDRELLHLFVEQQGHVAEQSDGGAAAVARVAAGGVDLVLMDLCMPDVDGLEATRRIRQFDGAAGRTPVWAVTARVLPHQVAQCLEAGMNGHLSKPVNLSLLGGILQGLQGAGASGEALVEASGC